MTTDFVPGGGERNAKRVPMTVVSEVVHCRLLGGTRSLKKKKRFGSDQGVGGNLREHGHEAFHVSGFSCL